MHEAETGEPSVAAARGTQGSAPGSSINRAIAVEECGLISIGGKDLRRFYEIDHFDPIRRLDDGWQRDVKNAGR